MKKRLILIEFCIAILLVHSTSAYLNWSNENAYPVSPAVYSETIQHNFNITWESDYPIHAVLMENNFTGSLQNQSVTGNQSNVYYYDHQSLAVGFYQWRQYAQNNISETNSTDVFYYQVNPATPVLTLTAIPSFSEVIDTETNISCTANTTQVTPLLYRNDRLVSNPDVQILGLGIYNYTCNVSSTQNFTAATTSKILSIIDEPDKEFRVKNFTLSAPEVIFDVYTPEDDTCYYQQITPTVGTKTRFSFTGGTFHTTGLTLTAGSYSYNISCSTNHSMLNFQVTTDIVDEMFVVRETSSIYTGDYAIFKLHPRVSSKGLSNIPKSRITVRLNNTSINFVVRDLGNGEYDVRFIPESAGYYNITFTVDNLAKNKLILVEDLLLTIKHFGTGFNPVSYKQIVYSPDLYMHGLASDDKNVFLAGNSTLLYISARASNNSFIFITRPAALENIDSYLETGTFLSLKGPSFGFKLLDKFIVNIILSYSDIIIQGNKNVQLGQNNLIIKNVGFNSSLNKTIIQIT
ncbi:hypothetical protein DRJ17_04835 [Candidatus Woesearchaeota archaeon]|nr:MAG: hypothetical protein DRJ17_04835 [Candidatus Woesearchaeota archaeon]